MRSCIRSLLLTAVVMASAGCSGALETYPITGKVTLKGGGPLAGALVEFQTTLPDGQTATAHGLTQDDGSYTLTTPDIGDGAIAGEHKVIVAPPSAEPGGAPTRQPRIDARFQSYAKTPLAFTVKPEGPHVFDIEVAAARR